MISSIKIIFLIFINIFSFTFAGTDGTIRGRVTDEESMGLPGATIYLPELGVGAAAVSYTHLTLPTNSRV